MLHNIPTRAFFLLKVVTQCFCTYIDSAGILNPIQGLEVNTLKACIGIQIGHCIYSTQCV